MDSETAKTIDTYNDEKVEEIIELEVKMNEKSDTIKRETIIRKIVLGAGILSAIYLRSVLFNFRFNASEFLLGSFFTAGFFGIYFGRLGNKPKLETDLVSLKQDYNREKDNLDLEGIELLEVKRKELKLNKKKSK